MIKQLKTKQITAKEFWGRPGLFPKANCGETVGYYLRKCACGITPLKVKHNSLTCGCYKSYVAKKANQVYERLEDVTKLYKIPLRYCRHIVLSPPPGFFGNLTVEQYRVLRRQVRKHLNQLGAKGGLIIYHHIRTEHQDGSECKDKKNCKLRHDDVVSPHFHVIAWGYLKSSNKFYKETGWIYKTIRYKGQSGFQSKKDVIFLFNYLMSHCGILYIRKKGSYRMGNKVVSWFGDASTARIKKVGNGVEYSKCSRCGEIIIIGYKRNGEFVPLRYNKIQKYKYVLRAP